MIYDSGKLRIMDSMLPRLKEQGRRVVILSRSNGMVDLLESYLRYVPVAEGKLASHAVIFNDLMIVFH